MTHQRPLDTVVSRDTEDLELVEITPCRGRTYPSSHPYCRPSSFVRSGRSLSAADDATSQELEDRVQLLSDQNQQASSPSRSCLLEQRPIAGSTVLGDDVPSDKLRKSSYTVYLVCMYAAVTTTAWILTCLLTVMPLTIADYEFDFRDKLYAEYTAQTINSKYIRSAQISKLARTMQATIGVLTIPLTSAVCSAAAVVYVQSSKEHRAMTLRQLVTLADKGWNDPGTMFKIICGDWSRYGSFLLFLAILLNILGVLQMEAIPFVRVANNEAGAVLAPLQTIFLTQKLIKTPTSLDSVRPLVDIANQFDPHLDMDNNLVTVRTRGALTTAILTDPQPRLWYDQYNCSQLSNRDFDALVRCSYGTVTLGTLPLLENPYLAQLPSGYHTGVIRQFIPRFNSTVEWDQIPQSAMPVECEALPGSFWSQYAYAASSAQQRYDLEQFGSQPQNWSIEVCMPGDQSQSPWKNTYHRQDFTEEMFLNISVMGYDGPYVDNAENQAYSGIFKVTSKTTAGHFELPNYMNGGLAGSLLPRGPREHCGSDCVPQNFVPEGQSPIAPDANREQSESPDLSLVRNKGVSRAPATSGCNLDLPNAK